MMEESLKIIHAAWTEETVEFKGRFYQIPEITVNPKPLQKPPPLIYSANSSLDGVEFAAGLGLNVFLPIQTLSRDRVKSLGKAYWDGLRAHGHDVSKRELGLLIPVYIAETNEEAERQAQAGVMDYYRVISKTRNDYRDWLTKRGLDAAKRLPPVAWEGMTFERVCAEHAILADPKKAVVELKNRIEETGATHLLGWMNIGSMPHELVLRSMELFAREVMPAFA